MGIGSLWLLPDRQSPSFPPPCLSAVGNGPNGIAFDSAHMWVANNDGGTVTEL